jgi:LL-diaminopimelate aminotransferase
MRELGWSFQLPRGSFYIWVKVPQGYTTTEYCEFILDNARVIITPGNGYGQYGEEYFRVALTVDAARIREAMARIKSVS